MPEVLGLSMHLRFVYVPCKMGAVDLVPVCYKACDVDFQIETAAVSACTAAARTNFNATVSCGQLGTVTD